MTHTPDQPRCLLFRHAPPRFFPRRHRQTRGHGKRRPTRLWRLENTFHMTGMNGRMPVFVSSSSHQLLAPRATDTRDRVASFILHRREVERVRHSLPSGIAVDASKSSIGRGSLRRIRTVHRSRRAQAPIDAKCRALW